MSAAQMLRRKSHRRKSRRRKSSGANVGGANVPVANVESPLEIKKEAKFGMNKKKNLGIEKTR
jgi:hypothetical protein